MVIEIISIPDCPNHRPTLERARALLISASISAEIKEILVNTTAHAEAIGFMGSPTVRVNGRDVEPLPAMQASLSCRIYENGSGIPPEALLKQAISSASQNVRQA